MARLRFTEVGRSVGACRACAATAVLTVTESRYTRGWRESLDPRFDGQASRTATCSACRCTYPIRHSDSTAADAGRRGEVDPVQRDWDYSRSA